MKRYRVIGDSDYGCYRQEDNNGEYVLYSDAKKLEERVKELEEALEKIAWWDGQDSLRPWEEDLNVCRRIAKTALSGKEGESK